jgi:hypothetical protein
MLSDIPPGTHCFVDAYIFYYHLVETDTAVRGVFYLCSRIKVGKWELKL